MAEREYYPIAELEDLVPDLVRAHPHRSEGLAIYLNSSTFSWAILERNEQDRFLLRTGSGRLGRFGPQVYLGPADLPVYSRRTVPNGMFELDFS